MVTLINVFGCEPKNQQHLIDAWVRATEETFGKLPGVISVTLHRARTERVWSTKRNGRVARTGRIFARSGASLGSAKWESTRSRTLTFMRSVTCWTKRKAREVTFEGKCS